MFIVIINFTLRISQQNIFNHSIEFKFNIMYELFAAGDAYLKELEDFRTKGKAATAAAYVSATGEKRRKKKGSALKDRDPL